MPWPLSQDYNEAIQNPQTSFGDPELRGGQVVTNAMGIPMPCSGNFADVYEFHGASGTRWAIKCFTREVPGLQDRYTAISKHLAKAKLPFTVEFEYLARGIRIRGQFYPVLKMEWVDGFLLNEFVRQNLDKPALLDGLGQIWLRMARRLRGADMAHADLQHCNVLLVPARANGSLSVKLIDYDGMWVPALANKRSGEVGHPAYQHPQRLRENRYSAEVDRVPLWVVACALRCLFVGGKPLWDRYDNGDNMLFREQDLQKPERSALFKELQELPDSQARFLVEELRKALKGNLEDVTAIDELLSQRKAASLSVPASTPIAGTPEVVHWYSPHVGVSASSPTTVKAGEAGAIFSSPLDLDEARSPKREQKEKVARRAIPIWGLVGGGAVIAVLLISIFLMGFLLGNGRQKKHEPAGAPRASSSEAAQIPDPGQIKQNPPPVSVPPDPPPPSLNSLPAEERDRIKKAIERGVAFLRKTQLPEGTWKGGPAVGLAALPGLTLLECGIPADDPQAQKAAAFVRTGGPRLNQTYEIALAILFLDRLGNPADEDLIQSLALRLIRGQTTGGGWNYVCQPLNKEMEAKLLMALKETRPRSAGDLFVAGPDGRKPDWFVQVADQPAPPVDHARALASLPGELHGIPALQAPVPAKPFPTQDASDNSNTQFAALGLWVTGRHGIPIERALALLTTRFRTSQAADGGWNYNYNPRGASTPAMTGAGLIGLAMGHGLVANHTAPPADPGNQSAQRVVPDAALAKGLSAIASHIGQVQDRPLGKNDRMRVNLYFLWTLERVAMLYNFPKIDGKDWYRWGAQELVEIQKDQGNWDTAAYPGSGAVIDTSLALLFLQRANVAKDLTRKIEYLGRVRLPEK